MEQFLSVLKASIKKTIQVIVNLFKVAKMAISEPNKYNIINTVIEGRPFDYSYLWYIEYAKLIEMRDYFKTANIAESDAQTAKEIDFAIKLLYIVTHDTDYFHFEDPYPNEVSEEVWKRDHSDLKYSLSTFNADYWKRHHVYKCDVYCNTKNASRFVHPSVIEFYQKHPHELYIEKARHLYHLIRERNEQNWSN